MNRNKIFVVILLLFCFVVLFSTQKALDSNRSPEAELEENLYLPDGKILKIVSLGFNSLLSDFLWVKSVLYFGKFTLDDENPFIEVVLRKMGKTMADLDHNHSHENENGTQNTSTHLESDIVNSSDMEQDSIITILQDFEIAGMAPHIYPLLRRVVELNPHFIYPYEFGGLIVLHQTGKIDEAYSLLEFGWENNPQRWEIAYFLGFVDLVYRNDSEQALKWLSHAALIPGHLPVVEKVYNSLLNDENNKVAIVEYLNGIFSTTKNTKIQEQIVEMINKISNSP